MAIEPFRQQIGVPGGAGITSQSIQSVQSAGDDLMRLAGVAMNVMEPRLKQQAVDQAKADFQRVGLAKDEQGNYVMPETPEGGLVYAAAFDQAAQGQYLLSVQHDTETKLNDIYSNPANVGKSPMELRAQAEALVSGTLEKVDPDVYQPLFETLTREVRQRDLAASNAWMRQQTALMERDFTLEVNSSLERYMDAVSLDPESADAQAQATKVQAAMEQLVRIGARSQRDLDLLPMQLQAARGAGEVMQLWREGQEGLTADDNATLAAILNDTAPEGATVLGLSREDIYEKIPDAQMRDRLAARINSRTDDMRRIEAEQAAEARAEDVLDYVPTGSGKPFGVSDEKWGESLLNWSQRQGIDPYSPAGVLAMFTKAGDLPKAIYKPQFQDLALRDPADIERRRDLYLAMNSLVSKSGQTVQGAFTVMENADAAFMYHYDNARRSGSDAATAARTAATMQQRELGRSLEEMRGTLREAGGYKDNKKLWEAVDDWYEKTGLDFDTLNQAARDTIETDMAQLVAMGVPFDAAAQRSAERFKANWKISNLTLDNGLAVAGKGKMAWVPRTHAVPEVRDPNDPTRTTARWVHGYVAERLKVDYGEQVPGVPAGKDIAVGKNAWFYPTGRTTRDGGMQFNLMYFDPKLGNPPTVIMAKDGPMIFEFNRALKKQQAAVTDHIRGRARALANIERLKVEARPSPGFGEGMDSKFPMRGVQRRGADPAAKARLEQAQREFEERYGTRAGKREQVGVTPEGAPIYDTTPAKPKRSNFGPVNVQDVMPSEGYRNLRQIAEDGADMGSLPNLARQAARELGVTPQQLLAIASYESAGSFDPKIKGGDGGNYWGIFQFGKEERESFGWGPTLEQQFSALVRFAKARGYRPGMGWRKLYTTINAGNPGAATHARDSNGSQLDHYMAIMEEHMPKARRVLDGG